MEKSIESLCLAPISSVSTRSGTENSFPQDCVVIVLDFPRHKARDVVSAVPERQHDITRLRQAASESGEEEDESWETSTLASGMPSASTWKSNSSIVQVGGRTPMLFNSVGS